jgi:hypothetical protein
MSITLGNNIITDGLSNVFTPASSVMKNRIINGAMVIDQRYGGSAFGTSINGYTIDRWAVYVSTTGKINGGQNYNSVTPPVGFSNYLGFQSQSAYSISSTDYFTIRHSIEGFNTADLAWGTANAKTVTLSFWVYSSLTGTFGGSISNGAQNYSYPFTYTISSASTWTQISITITGPTSGTWVGATNGTGMMINLGLGIGSTLSGTAGSWSANNYTSATGAVSVVGTNNATFYITGVQLEVGLNATNFEYRQYGTELALCQRYCTVINSGTACYGTATSGSAAYRMKLVQSVPLRASPTTTFSGITIAVPGIAGQSLSSVGTTYFASGFVEYDLNAAAGYSGTLGQTAVCQGTQFVVSSEL